MKQHLRYWTLLIALFGCQDSPSELDTIGENLRDDTKISFIYNTIPIGVSERLPGLPVNPAYFVMMKQPTVEDPQNSIAYPVNCGPDEDADKVLSAFALDKKNPERTDFNVAMLKEKFAAHKQPILNCSDVLASSAKRKVSVFRLQDNAGQAAQDQVIPTYYLKFNDFPDQLFQVGCLDILNKFAAGSGENVNFAETAIPLPDAHILPYLAQDIKLPEEGSNDPVRGDQGIRRLFCRPEGKILPKPAAITPRSLPAIPDLESKLLYVNHSYYVYSWSGGSRRLECFGAKESAILQAFNSTLKAAESADSDHPAVLMADQFEPLRCPNNPSLNHDFRAVDVKPERHAYKSSRESSELITFGCPSAEKFFVGDSIKAQNRVDVSFEAFDHLISHRSSSPIFRVERVHIPCADFSNEEYKQYFDAIFLASLNRLPTAQETAQYISKWRKGKLLLSDENAAKERQILSQTMKTDTVLRQNLIKQAIAAGKADHVRFKGMDKNAVYSYESSYFDNYVLKEVSDANLSQGLYRHLYDQIRTMRSHLPRTMMDASYELVSACHLDAKNNCKLVSDYLSIFKFMYKNSGKNLVQNDLVKEHERLLDNCVETSCPAISSLGSNVCIKNSDTGCSVDKLPGLNVHLIMLAQIKLHAVLPNKASLQCYLRKKKDNSDFDCRFHTLDAAAAPFRN